MSEKAHLSVQDQAAPSQRASGAITDTLEAQVHKLDDNMTTSVLSAPLPTLLSDFPLCVVLLKARLRSAKSSPSTSTLGSRKAMRL